MANFNFDSFSSKSEKNLSYIMVYDFAQKNKMQLTKSFKKNIRKSVQNAVENSEALNADVLNILKASGFFNVNKEVPKLKAYLKLFPIAVKKVTAKKTPVKKAVTPIKK